MRASFPTSDLAPAVLNGVLQGVSPVAPLVDGRSVDGGKTIFAVAAAALCLFARVACAEVEVLWLGHATFRLTSTTGKVIVIDPFLKKNPRTPAKYKDLAALGKVDLILVTHGHRDHIGDLAELAFTDRRNRRRQPGLANNLVALGLLNGSKAIAMDKGGTVAPLGPAIKVHMVPA